MGEPKAERLHRGNTLRIVSETVSVGKRVTVARCEVSLTVCSFGWLEENIDRPPKKIFEVETGSIVASGQQVKMNIQSNIALNVPFALL